MPNNYLYIATGLVTGDIKAVTATFTGAISASNFTGSLSGTNTGDVTLGAFGSSPNANGASLSGQILTLQPANSTNAGGLSITTQTIAGQKTFFTHLGPQIVIQDSTGAFGTDASPYFTFRDATTLGAELGFSISNAKDFYINNRTTTGNLYLMTNATVAITIDSSQNTTIAGTNHTVPNTLTFVAGSTITANSTEIAINHLRIGGLGGPQIATTSGLFLLSASIRFSALTANTALFVNVNKDLTSSTTTDTQLAYLDIAAGRTGTGNLVYSTSPVFTTNITVPTLVTFGVGGPTMSSNATEISVDNHLRIGGVGGFQLSNSSGDLSLSGGDVRFQNQTATTAVYLDSAKRLTSSSTTPTQLAYLDIATGRTGTANLVYSAGPTFSGQVLVANGTLANPSIGGSGDTNTGVLWSGGDDLELVSGGSTKITVLPTQVAISNAQLRNDDGSAASPAYSWSNQTNMGLLRSASNQTAMSIAGIATTYWGVGYFGAERSYVGARLLNYVKNTDNTNSVSDAALEAVSGGASGGDALVHFVINGVTDWAIGIDNSDADSLVFSQSNTLGTNNYLKITTAGAASFPGTLTPSGGIVGVTTNSNATAGHVGETVSSSVSTYANLATSGDYNNVTSLDISPGDWIVSGCVMITLNGATTPTEAYGVVLYGQAGGGSNGNQTGAVQGQSTIQTDGHNLTGTHALAIAIPPYRVSVPSGASAPKIYLKARLNVGAGTVQALGSVIAIRIR